MVRGWCGVPYARGYRYRASGFANNTLCDPRCDCLHQGMASGCYSSWASPRVRAYHCRLARQWCYRTKVQADRPRDDGACTGFECDHGRTTWPFGHSSSLHRLCEYLHPQPPEPRKDARQSGSHQRSDRKLTGPACSELSSTQPVVVSSRSDRKVGRHDRMSIYLRGKVCGKP